MVPRNPARNQPGRLIHCVEASRDLVSMRMVFPTYRRCPTGSNSRLRSTLDGCNPSSGSAGLKDRSSLDLLGGRPAVCNSLTLGLRNFAIRAWPASWLAGFPRANPRLFPHRPLPSHPIRDSTGRWRSFEPTGRLEVISWPSITVKADPGPSLKSPQRARSGWDRSGTRSSPKAKSPVRSQRAGRPAHSPSRSSGRSRSARRESLGLPRSSEGGRWRSSASRSKALE
jgi:hypothetical protein